MTRRWTIQAFMKFCIFGWENKSLKIKRDWEQEVLGFASESVIPSHLEEVRSQRLEQIDKVEREVKARLTKEITYWDRRAQDLKAKERSGNRRRRSGHKPVTATKRNPAEEPSK